MRRHPAITTLLLVLGLKSGAQQAGHARAEVWQGTNLVSVSNGKTLPGYTRGVALLYRYHRKKSAISFEAGVMAGALRLRSEVNSTTQLVVNHGFLDALLSASYHFSGRFSMGPALHLMWLSGKDIRFRNTLTRVTFGHSDFGPGYEHWPFQPSLGLVAERSIGERKRFSLKLMILQQVSNLLSRDYEVDFFSTPPSPLKVLSASVKPTHLVFGVTYTFQKRSSAEQVSAHE